MTRSLSQTCYSCLMLTSKMVLIVTSASMVFTLTASAVFNDEQLDALANVIHYITKLVFYLTISIGSFILGKVSSQVRHQKEQEKHAAVLQAATRRRLSQRSPTVYKAAQAKQPKRQQPKRQQPKRQQPKDLLHLLQPSV